MQSRVVKDDFIKGNDTSRPADAWGKDLERRNNKSQTPEVKRIWHILSEQEREQWAWLGQM